MIKLKEKNESSVVAYNDKSKETITIKEPSDISAFSKADVVDASLLDECIKLFENKELINDILCRMPIDLFSALPSQRRYDIIVKALNTNTADIKSMQGHIGKLPEKQQVLLFEEFKNNNKFRNEIFFAIKNERTKLSLLAQDSTIDIEMQVAEVGRLKSDKLKLSFLKQRTDLEIKHQAYIIARMDDDKIKLNFLKQYPNLAEEDIVDIIKHVVNDKTKLEYLNYNSDLNIELKISIISSMQSDEIKLDFLKNNDNIDMEYQLRLMMRVKSDEAKNDFLKRNKDNKNLDNHSAYWLARSIKSEKLLIDFLMNRPQLDDDYKLTILCNNFSTKTLNDIYTKNLFNAQNIISFEYLIKKQTDYKEVLKLIRNNLDKFNSNLLTELNSRKEYVKIKDIIKILKSNQKDLNTEQSIFLMLNSSPRQQKKIFTSLKELDDVNKYIALQSLQTVKHNKKMVQKELEQIRISPEVKNRINRAVENLGFSACANEHSAILFSEQALQCFDEASIYQLLKYFSYTNTLPDVSKAINNPEVFKSFQSFRTQNIVNDTLNVVTLQKTLVEFDKYFDLISTCMNEGMTEEEKAILVTILNDEAIKITSKEDLHNYPQIRSQYIDQMIEDSPYDAIYFILTGSTFKEYKSKGDLFYSDKQLAISQNEFGEELQDDIKAITLAKEIISMLEKEPEENLRNILHALKNNIEQEFTFQEEPTAYIRQAYNELSTKIQLLYGKELQESLTESQLPPMQKDGDVDVISLNGEEFKLLIHGLNAYGKGSSEYEVREVGKAYICTSLISDVTLHRAQAGIYYGFKNISSRALVLEGTHDIYSYAKPNSLEVKSKNQPTFLTTDEFLKSSGQKRGYNEVVLYRDQIDEQGISRPLMPDYIVSFDKITDQEREEARRLNIPIVVINERAYATQVQDDNKEKTGTENIEIKADATSQIRDFMMNIIEQAKNNCTAIQQEAIMHEIQKEFAQTKDMQTEKEG